MKKKIICIFIFTLLIAIIPLSTEAIYISKKNREKISYFENEIDDVGWYTSLALYNDIPHNDIFQRYFPVFWQVSNRF